MNMYTLDPLVDPRWSEFLQRHPDASVFHTIGWLRALQRTYGYEPVVYTTTPPRQELENGIVFCRVKSRLTGQRLVSLPFSDHCQPLLRNDEELSIFLSYLNSQLHKPWKYFELRPLRECKGAAEFGASVDGSETYVMHTLDLRPDLSTLFKRCHKLSIQDKVRKAERKGGSREEGRSLLLLEQFYELLLLTRRRHQLPPQPLQWFQNLIDSMGDQSIIRILYKDGRPVTGTLGLRFKKNYIAKYGCSDPEFYYLGGMPHLLWRAIQASKTEGIEELDFGRSEPENQGLVHFKDNFGATRSISKYYRCPPSSPKLVGSTWPTRLAKLMMSKMPDSMLKATGRLLYPHIG